jgi:hypothetical protein
MSLTASRAWAQIPSDDAMDAIICNHTFSIDCRHARLDAWNPPIVLAQDLTLGKSDCCAAEKTPHLQATKMMSGALLRPSVSDCLEQQARLFGFELEIYSYFAGRPAMRACLSGSAGKS